MEHRRMSAIYYDETNHPQVAKLLIGRRVVKVSDNTLRLDDGRELVFDGHDGGCACGAGDYELTALNEVDNVITRVEFLDSPDGDDHPCGDGRYEIFVFADNKMVNLATFKGTDGNGYYGTGYQITVRTPVASTPDAACPACGQLLPAVTT
jgi:hypothetical protein